MSRMIRIALVEDDANYKKYHGSVKIYLNKGWFELKDMTKYLHTLGDTRPVK